MKLSLDGNKFKSIYDRDPASGRNALHIAAKENDFVCLKTLIEAGSEYDKEDKKGKTPLKTAINQKYKWDAANQSNLLSCDGITLLIKKSAKIVNFDFANDKEEKMNILRECTKDI